MRSFVIRYDLGISRKEIKDAIKAEVRKKAIEARMKKIASVTCPVHGIRAKAILEKGSIQVHVCCDDLRAAVAEELKPE